MAEDRVDEQEGDDLSALIGEGPIPFPEKTEREFQPWHRPRKHYVRRMQWAREIGFLARDLGLTSELRYLTLPGSDLLDIRHLAQSVCADLAVRLKYLGFNSAASPSDEDQPGLNAAQFSINRLQLIHPESEVFPGDFRGIGDARSVPWQRVRRAGPFHAINVDLCGGFAGREKAPGIPNYFTALKALLQNQRSSDEDFLLFITTRMDDNSIDTRILQSLTDVAQHIHDTCRAYASEFAVAWGMPAEGQAVCLTDLVRNAELFMLGLTQWIVSEGANLGLKASVRSFMTYRTGSRVGDDDIVSLAIRFKADPYVQPDPQGLVRTVDGVMSLDERVCLQSAAIPKQVSNRVLVDEKLRTQAEEFERCMDESSLLLETAGYDPKSYRAWVWQEADRYARA